MRFITLFLPSENVHLTKDVGMIPFILYKYYGYNSTLACYKNGSYPYQEKEVKGLKIKFVKKIFNQPDLDGLLFLIQNYRKYDILMGFHLVRTTTLWLLLFQLLKGKKGISYLKLDTDDRFNLNNLSKRIFYNWYKYSILKIKLISAETKKMQQLLQNEWKQAIEYIPNGFYDWGDNALIKYEEKENLIITIGRIGSFQKSNHILCEAFLRFYETNRSWKLMLIGPVLPDFERYMSRLYEKFPKMKEVIILTGNISSKEELYKYYRKAKIFALTSRHEGFPLVFPEAIRFGCFIVSTNIGSAYDITDAEKYGRLFQVDDIHSLTFILNDVSNNESLLNEMSLQIQKYSRDNFFWPLIAGRLNDAINRITKA